MLIFDSYSKVFFYKRDAHTSMMLTLQSGSSNLPYLTDSTEDIKPSYYTSV